jgi:hypothetical protein
MLTETQIKATIRNAPTSGKKSIALKDGGERGAGRLALLIRPFAGRVTAEWYAIWYRDGKRVSVKISMYPILSLADARKKFREEYAPAISTGGEPTAPHARRRHQAESRVTVTELFRAYIDDLKRSGKRSQRHAERILLSDTTGAARAIGADRPAAEIEANDIVPFLAEIHGRGSVVMAHSARAFIGAAFAFGLKAAHDYTRKSTDADWGLKANPVLAIKADSTAHRTRDRYLRPTEFRAFWNWLVNYDELSRFAPALRLMMATGQRAEEILRIGFESRYVEQQRMIFWDKTKNGLPHSIPLPPHAVEILGKLTPNKHGILFYNSRHPEKVSLFDALGSVTDRYVMETGTERFCPRDIRRTWKTLSGEAGISKDMRDRLQNHTKSDISSRHYDRYEYLAERRAAMAQWGAYLDRILSGDLDELPSAEVIAIATDVMRRADQAIAK